MLGNPFPERLNGLPSRIVSRRRAANTSNHAHCGTGCERRAYGQVAERRMCARGEARERSCLAPDRLPFQATQVGSRCRMRPRCPRARRTRFWALSPPSSTAIEDCYLPNSSVSSCGESADAACPSPACLAASMQIRLVRRLAARFNGIDLSRRRAGDCFDTPDADAAVLIDAGWAMPARSDIQRGPRSNDAARRQRHQRRKRKRRAHNG